MSRFSPSQNLDALEDKVFILTGGANGIGAACVQLWCSHGAYVCFGDLDHGKGRALQDEMNEKYPSTEFPGRTAFVPTDVTDYNSVVALFDHAVGIFGRIDCAVSNAGVIEQGSWFDPSLDIESVRKPDTNKVVEVNLLGTLYFTRLASVYLRQDKSRDKSIILLSSVAGFKESPGLFVYQATKHAIIGIMRSLRLYAPTHLGYRINTVCPSMTATDMTSGIADSWIKTGSPVNQPSDIADIISHVACREDLNGESIFVEGGRGWKFEEALDKLEPQWLGEEASGRLKVSQEALGMGSKWQD